MALRALASRLGVQRPSFSRAIQSRSFSSGTGKILSEEERAAENMYIKKMEKEKLEKAAGQGVKPEESTAKSSSTGPGSLPDTQTSTDSTKNIAVVAGIVALIAGGWWYLRANTKPKEEEKE